MLLLLVPSDGIPVVKFLSYFETDIWISNQTSTTRSPYGVETIFYWKSYTGLYKRLNLSRSSPNHIYDLQPSYNETYELCFIINYYSKGFVI